MNLEKFERIFEGEEMKIFDFPDVNNEYYIIEERLVIVFQFVKPGLYIYWDLEGREDHRIIVSAKGPFDNNLEVKEGISWKEFSVDEDEFIWRAKKEPAEIRDLWEKYYDSWLSNIKSLASKSFRNAN